MKSKSKRTSKKNRYSTPKITRHDVKNLLNNWAFSAKGVVLPEICTCQPPE